MRRVVMPARYVSGVGDRAADAIREFLRLESAGGILLMRAAAAGLILANTRAEGLYHSLLGTPVEIRIGALVLAKPLVLWINDGLMAVLHRATILDAARRRRRGDRRARGPQGGRGEIDCGVLLRGPGVVGGC
jgi:NhaA family Na+:H+ antiporter